MIEFKQLSGLAQWPLYSGGIFGGIQFSINIKLLILQRLTAKVL